jgi:ribose transport system ATP-binding protein
MSGRPGEELAICGANGPGKSTLSKLLAGLIARPREIRLLGVPMRDTLPREGVEAGVLIMYQEPLIIPHLSVAETFGSLTSIDRELPYGSAATRARPASFNEGWPRRRRSQSISRQSDPGQSSHTGSGADFRCPERDLNRILYIARLSTTRRG